MFALSRIALAGADIGAHRCALISPQMPPDANLQVNTTASIVVGSWVRLLAATPLASAPPARGRRRLAGAAAVQQPAPRPLIDAFAGQGAGCDAACQQAWQTIREWRQAVHELGLDRPEHAAGCLEDGAGGDGCFGASSAAGTLDAYLYGENAVDSGRGECRQPLLFSSAHLTLPEVLSTCRSECRSVCSGAYPVHLKVGMQSRQHAATLRHTTMPCLHHILRV